MIGISALTLRALAILFMLIDHIGYFTGNSLCRIVGRLALPIFAFLIANGFKYTRNVYKYALRLFVFALISEFAFDYAFYGKISFVEFVGVIPDLKFDNIFFTLLIGLCYLFVNKLLKEKVKRGYGLLSAASLLVLAYGATFISADYGALGVLWVALFGVFDVADKKSRIPLAAGAVLLAVWRVLCKSLTAALNLPFSNVFFVNAFILGGNIGYMDKIQCFAALSIIFIFLYNGKSGSPKSPVWREVVKYFFYAFYPLHILVLYWILG